MFQSLFGTVDFKLLIPLNNLDALTLYRPSNLASTHLCQPLRHNNLEDSFARIHIGSTRGARLDIFGFFFLVCSKCCPVYSSRYIHYIQCAILLCLEICCYRSHKCTLLSDLNTFNEGCLEKKFCMYVNSRNSTVRTVRVVAFVDKK